MDKSAHKQRHIELHKAFDELLADFIAHTKELPMDRKISDLMEWSYRQTLEPNHHEPDVHVPNKG